MKFAVATLTALFFLATGCTGAEDGNADSASEVSCSSATGLWTISSATCDGASVAVDTVSLLINSSTSMTQSMGTSACSSTFDWDVVVGSFDNSLSLTGNGFLSCSANGSSVGSCVDGSNSCSNSVDMTGYQNNFDACAVSGSEMVFLRTVSSGNNPDGFSFCSDGEEEVVTLTQSSTDPTGPAVLSIAGADPADFGSISTGSSQNMTLVLSNDGGEIASSIAASGLAAPFAFAGGAYPGAGGTCSASLAAGTSCNLVVNYSPTVVGTDSDSLILSYNDSAANQSLTHGLAGTGVSASLGNITISESDPYDFGSQSVGGSVSHTFTLTNTGSGSATSLSEVGLAAPFSFVGGSYPGTGGDCATTLAGGGSCTIQVEFSPSASGLASDTIDISYNNGSSVVNSTRDVQGTGGVPAVLVISDGPVYDFGSIAVAGSTSHVFTVTNTGGTMAISIAASGLAAPFSFAGGAYPGASGTCTSILSAGSSCTMEVSFQPTASGAFADTILLDYNDGSSAQQATRDVQGSAP